MPSSIRTGRGHGAVAGLRQMTEAKTAPPSTRAARINRSRMIAILLVFVALGLRLYRIDYQSIWVDEGYSIILAAEPLYKLVARVAPDHAPFYFLLLHYWMQVAGRSELAVRFLSAVSGVLLVALTYRVGKDWLGARAAVLAALVATVSPFAIYYSQEARMHVQATMLGLLSVALLLRAARANTAWAWLQYSLAVAAAIYSFYYAALVPLAEGLFLILSPADRRLLLRWLGSQLLVAALLGPWLVYDVPRLVAYAGPRSRGLEAPTLLSIAGQVWLSTFGGRIDDWASLQVATIPLLLPVGMSAVRLLRLARRQPPPAGHTARLLLWTCCAVPLVVAYFANLLIPNFQPRYLLVVAPFVYLLLACGTLDLASFIAGRRLNVNLVTWLAIAITSSYVIAVSTPALWRTYFDARYARDDYRAIVRTIEAESPGGSAVILNAGWQVDAFAYYQRATLPVYGIQPPLAPADVAEFLQGIMAQHPLLWLVLYGNASSDPGSLVEAWLDQHAFKLEQQWYGQVRVVRYVAHLPADFDLSSAPHPMRYQFDGGLALIGYQLRPGNAAPQSMTIELYWQASEKVREDYTAFIHFVDGSDVVRAQSDAMPLGIARPTSRWQAGEIVRDVRRIDLPPDLPAGTYAIEAGVYRAADGVRKEVQTEKGRRLGSRVVLETVDIPVSPSGATLGRRRPWGVSFGDLVLLESLAMPDPLLRAGETKPIMVEWRALREIEADYTVFLHVVDGAGRLVAQVDAQPGNGFKPTSAWPVGPTIADRLALSMPPSTPPDHYTICMGLYDLATMRRLGPSRSESSARCGNEAVEIGGIVVGDGGAPTAAGPSEK